MKAFSYGGGVQSNAVMVLQAKGLVAYDYFVFANVGAKAENPATLKYIEEIAKPFMAKHGIKFVEVSRNPRNPKSKDLRDHLQRAIDGELRSIDIPVRLAPGGAPAKRNCTGVWKIEPVAKWLKANSVAVLGKGISIDEIKRACPNSGFAHYSVEYPLIDLDISRMTCYQIIAQAELPEPPKSSCVFCPFHSHREWVDMRQNDPELFAQAVELEAGLSNRRKQLKNSQGKLRDGCYLSQKGARNRLSLDVAVEDQLLLDYSDIVGSGCSSGYCGV